LFSRRIEVKMKLNRYPEHCDRLINNLDQHRRCSLSSCVVLSFLWLVACLLNGSFASAQTLKPVVFATSATDVSASPIFVAEELGFFKAEGIDSKIVVIRSDIVMKGLVTGDIDFASSISSVVKAAAIGAPVKTLINFFNGSFFYLVTKPNITNVEQLKGKT